MAWLLKNAISGLLLPPCNLLVLQVAGLVLWKSRPRLSGIMVTGSLAGLFLCTMPVTAVKMIEVVEWQEPALKIDDADLHSRADAIVVLGAGRTIGAQEYGGRITVSLQGMLRLRYAADLRRRASKPILVTGGSPGAQGPSEGELMARALSEELGSKAEWIESRSDNTAENAEFSYAILGPKKVKRIFLVTEAWHMPRAARAFRHAGFEVVPAPMGYISDEGGGGSVLGWIPSSKGMEMSYLAMHEGIGSLWYHLRGVD